MSHPAPTSWTIQINDDQRQALIAVLKAANIPTGDDSPLDFWVAMLTELPTLDCPPNTVHGFCL